jgi:UDP:flavonoid glycosyltransferase YjiC (YdhE family)
VVPLARALCAAGHEVKIATEEGFCRVVERCGFLTEPAGTDPFAPLGEDHEFSEPVTRRKVEDILQIASSWRFDLILRDPTDFAAVIAAEALAVPQATVGFAFFCDTKFWRGVFGSSLDLIRASLGLPLDPELERLYSGLFIDTVPAWLQVTDGLPLHVMHRVRPEPYEAPAAPGAVTIDELPDEPMVLVTLGTVYNRNNPALLERLCRGAVGAGANVICTLGPRLDAASVPRLSGVQFVDYVPISGLLPHCAAVVTHGGYNTVLASILNGVPLMLVPLGSDNSFNATRCVDHGVGLSESPATLTEGRVAKLVSKLLVQTEYRDSAARLAADTATAPTVTSAVPLLERVAALTGRPHLPPDRQPGGS